MQWALTDSPRSMTTALVTQADVRHAFLSTSLAPSSALASASSFVHQRSHNQNHVHNWASYSASIVIMTMYRRRRPPPPHLAHRGLYRSRCHIIISSVVIAFAIVVIIFRIATLNRRAKRTCVQIVKGTADAHTSAAADALLADCCCWLPAAARWLLACGAG